MEMCRLYLYNLCIFYILSIGKNGLNCAKMRKIVLSFVIFFNSLLLANAEVISFDYILQESITNSYELNMSKLDTQIGEAGIKEAKSEYFPKFSGYLTAEHSNDLTNGSSPVSYIGNEVLLNNDRYQNAASLGLSYNLFDFGIRNKKVKIAEDEKEQKAIIYTQGLRDLKIKLVDIYGDALSAYKEYKTKEELLSIQSQLYQINERLNQAGKVRKTDVLNEAVKVAELTTQINNVKTDYAKALEELSYYAKQPLNSKEVQLLEFKERKNDSDIISVNYKKPSLRIGAQVNTFVLEKTPEFKIYELELAKKQKELDILKRKNLPSLTLDTRHYLYGTDPSNPMDSIRDLSERSMTVRIMSVFHLFDGFKTKSQKQKVMLEIEKIKLAKQQKMAELTKQFEQIKQDSEVSEKNLKESSDALTLVKKNIKMIDKLKDNQLISQTDYLEQKADLLNKQIVLEKNKIDNYIAQYKMNVLKGISK